MKSRAFFLLAVSVDLDMVPGAYHQPEDFPALFKDRLTCTGTYNPEVAVAYEGQANYTWSDLNGGHYIRPIEPHHLAEVVDRVPGQGSSSIMERHRIHKAEIRAAIRTLENAMENEDTQQHHLAGPLLRESQAAVDAFDKAKGLLLARFR
jgi:hypothetical protein